jgi:LysM repeat protein
MRSELDPTPAQEGGAADASGESRLPLSPGQPAIDQPGVTIPDPDAIHAADAAAKPPVAMPRGIAALDVVCPYLRSADGTWRRTRPQRDHRCWAQSPPAPLATLTQSRLCLTLAHTGCAIYGAALARRADELTRDRIAPERLSGSRFGALVQPVPLAMDGPSEHRLPTPAEGPARAVAALLIGLLAVVVLAGGIYVFAFGSQPALTPPNIGLASHTAEISVVPPTVPASLASIPGATGAATSQASIAPTPGPSATVPVVTRTYRVKPGDTLRSIAVRFGVTRAALLAVNDLGNPPVLTPGQRISIPAPPAAS